MPTVTHPREAPELDAPSRIEFSRGGPSGTRPSSLISARPSWRRRWWTSTATASRLCGPGLAQRRSLTLKAFFNTGTGFETTGTILSNQLVTLSRDESVVLKSYFATQDLEVGWSMSTVRPFDFDSDGLVDVAQLAPPAVTQSNPWAGMDKTVVAHINHGDRLQPVPSNPETNQWYLGLAHITLSNGRHWRVASRRPGLEQRRAARQLPEQ